MTEAYQSTGVSSVMSTVIFHVAQAARGDRTAYLFFPGGLSRHVPTKIMCPFEAKRQTPKWVCFQGITNWLTGITDVSGEKDPICL